MQYKIQYNRQQYNTIQYSTIVHYNAAQCSEWQQGQLSYKIPSSGLTTTDSTNNKLNQYITRMWANTQRDGRPAEYRWRPVLNAAKFGSRPLLDCRAVTLPIWERKTWRTQTEFCTWQNSVTEQQPPKMYTQSTSPGKGQTLWKVWLASVERRRCSNEAKTRKPLKLAGCPKLRKRSQPLVSWSSPYCEDMWRRYWCLTFFSDCRYVPCCED